MDYERRLFSISYHSISSISYQSPINLKSGNVEKCGSGKGVFELWMMSYECWILITGLWVLGA